MLKYLNTLKNTVLFWTNQFKVLYLQFPIFSYIYNQIKYTRANVSSESIPSALYLVHEASLLYPRKYYVRCLYISFDFYLDP